MKILSISKGSIEIYIQQNFQGTVTTAAVEIDCTEPEIKVSPRRTVEIDISDAQPNSGTVGDTSCSRQRRKKSSKMKSVEEENSASTSNPSRGKNTKQTADLTKIHFSSVTTFTKIQFLSIIFTNFIGSSTPIALPLPSRSRSSGGALKRHNARRDTKRVPYR